MGIDDEKYVNLPIRESQECNSPQYDRAVSNKYER